ncbi:hypothetical protein ACLB1Q_20170 [Escherichia coli]
MLDALTFDAGSTLTPVRADLDQQDPAMSATISMAFVLTDNRGFQADQLDIELNDADGQVGSGSWRCPDGVYRLERFCPGMQREIHR